MNCFLGRDARPGARSRRLSSPACIPGPRPGGNRAAAAAPGGNGKLPAPVGDGPGPVRYGGGGTPAGPYNTPGGGTPGPPGPPGPRPNIAAAAAASLKANSFRLSAIMAMIS